MVLYKSDRQFGLREYSESHHQLLVRSKPIHEYKANIDLLFRGVVYLDLHTSLPGVEISLATSDIIEALKKPKVLRNLRARDKVFVLSSSGRVYYIVAASLVITENTLSEFETGLELPGSRRFDMGDEIQTLVCYPSG
jgi:hypothetical protein